MATVSDNLRRVHGRLAQVIPHGDSLQLSVPGVPGEDEWGNPTTGTAATLSAPVPCKADRLNVEDAVKAGLSGSAEVWQVVTNAVEPVITPASVLKLTLSTGRSVSLAVRKVSGTTRQIVVGEVV